MSIMKIKSKWQAAENQSKAASINNRKKIWKKKENKWKKKKWNEINEKIKMNKWKKWRNKWKEGRKWKENKKCKMKNQEINQ